MDLPEKIYQRHYVELSRPQELTYHRIKEEQVAILERENGEKGMVSVTTVLAALVKLHQVCCGFVIDDENNIHDIPNHRLEAIRQLVDSEEGEKYVIWCVYRHSVETIAAYLESVYGRGCAVTYYGKTPKDHRVGHVDRFNTDPAVRFFVANKTASQGITLTGAARAFYHSTGYNLQDRLQSEDRIHRIGQSRTCLYTDILTPGTVEEKILKILETKQQLSDEVITSDWRNLIE